MTYADIVILALIAGFVLLRLRSVLGQKTGFEAPPYVAPPVQSKDTPIVQVPDIMARKSDAEDADKALVDKLPAADSAALASIKAADPGFTLAHFLLGARTAFEMTHDAFAKGDRDTLKMLLSAPLYDAFAGELDRRSTADPRSDTTLLAVGSQEATAINLEKAIARISVRFASEQVTVMRNKEEKIVGGNPSASNRVEDLWVFERDIHSKNPNWKIIET